MMKWIKCSEQMPKIGDVILMGHYRHKSWWWCGGTVEESDDGLFVDYEGDGEELDTDCWWMPEPAAPSGRSRMKHIDGIAVVVICFALFAAYLMSPLLIAAWRHHRCVTVAVWDGASLWEATKRCGEREE